MNMEISSIYIEKPSELAPENASGDGIAAEEKRAFFMNSAKPIKIWIALGFIVSLCLCGWGLVQVDREFDSDDGLTRLSLAVSRLMLADEVVIEDEAQRAADMLEQVLVEKDAIDGRYNQKELADLYLIAASIRDQLSKSDRKAAINTFVTFKKAATNLESKFYQTKVRPAFFGVNYFIAAGLIGLLICFSLLWFFLERSNSEEENAAAHAERSKKEADHFKFRFEEEQQRNIELQQRLMDLGKGSKKMESGIEEYTRAVSQLESAVKYLKASLGDAEQRIKSLESELADTSRSRDDGQRKLASMQAIIEAAERSEASMQSRIQQLEAELVQRSDGYSNDRSDIDMNPRFSNDDSSLEPSKTPLFESSEALPADLARLQSELIQERTRIQSEFAVVEWSNTKLKNELEEIKEQLLAARESLSIHEREARERILALEDRLLAEKKRALDELSNQFEAEVQFLREKLRAAHDQNLERSA